MDFKALFEDYNTVALLEHRGKPDPQKLRLRMEAHERGKLRHKNARERERMEEERRRERERLRRQRDREDLQRRLERSRNDRQSSQQQREYSKRYEEAQRYVESVNKSSAEYKSYVSDLETSGPSKEAQQVGKDISVRIRDIDSEFNQRIQDISAQSKLTDAELQRRRERELEWLEERYDDTEVLAEKKLKAKSDSNWFKRHFKKIRRAGIGTVDNIFDLMGYKDVAKDVKEATNYLLGK